MTTIRHYLVWILAAAMLVAPLGASASQQDYEITAGDANTGVTYRAAVNAALQALASLSSGNTSPTTTYAHQLWADTGNDLLKIRNAANGAWITIGRLSEVYLGLAALSAENEFTAAQKLKGDALLLRLKDTGTSGEEWALRSDGGYIEVLLNTGTESSPTWTAQIITGVNALRIGNGTSSNIDIIANNAAATKSRLRYQAAGSKWQYSNDGSTFNDMGSGEGGGGGSDSLPVGSLVTFMGPSCPAGTLATDGGAISRSTYASLFAVIGTMYGIGDGSTTFNKPDLRGYFLRGRDNGAGVDPDRASRTNRGDGTTGDNVGTKQSHQFYSHNHSASSSISHNPSYWDQFMMMMYNNAHGQAMGAPPVGEYGADFSWTWNSSNALVVSTSVAANGGNETRPVNINVLYCIKH